jgi:hypothetical protein
MEDEQLPDTTLILCLLLDSIGSPLDTFVCS